MSSDFPPPPGSATPASSNPGDFNLSAAFSWAWKKFQDNAAVLLVGTLLVAVAAFAISLIGNLVIGGILLSDPSFNMNTGEFSKGSGRVATMIVSALIIGLTMFVVYIVQASLIRVAMLIADGGKPEVSELFNFADAPRALVAGAIVGVATFIGYALCYLPGVLVAVATSYTLYFLVDKGLDPVESVKSSAQFVVSNIGTVIVVFLASAATVLLGVLACGVGVFVAIPVAVLVNAYAFRSLTGGTVSS
jgi:uncharacterized membrane protein